MIQQINDFIDNYKYKYDEYIINIYAYNASQGQGCVYVELNDDPPFGKGEAHTYENEYHELIFRDTYMKIYEDKIKVERIRKFAFYDKLLYIILFIEKLDIHDIPLLTKYHNERHIIESILVSNNDFKYSKIIDNNINNLEQKCYNKITLKKSIKLTEKIHNEIICIIDK